MTSNRRRWLYSGLLGLAILCSFTSLFALVKMGAPRGITSLNTFSLVLILIALATRGRDSV